MLEIRNKEVELGKDRRIEIQVIERQHANKTSTIPKATIRSIETIGGNNIREVELLEIRNKEVELGNDRRIEI